MQTPWQFWPQNERMYVYVFVHDAVTVMEIS